MAVPPAGLVDGRGGLSLPTGPPPWFGLDEPAIRSIEVHQTRAVASAGREWRDLGDAVLLHARDDPEPFFNRLAAVRWPAAPAGFDRRLTETLVLFATLRRRPYLWVIPGLSQPADIVARLRANGFVDLGGGYDMLLVRAPDRLDPSCFPPGSVLERIGTGPRADRTSRARELALVIEDSFGMDPRRRPGLEDEIEAAMGTAAFHACLLRVEGQPVATGQRFTFDGASYLSSIGTRPAWRGRGYGALVTAALAGDSLADGARLVYLGVHVDNDRAIAVYRRVGFEILGPRSADLLLR